MKTIQTLLLLAAITVVQQIRAQGFGEIKGLIKDDDLNPVIGAVVKITQGGYLIGGTTTDVEGYYSYKPLNVGEYELVVTSQLHAKHHVTRINVKPNEATYVDVKMKLNTLDAVEITTTFDEPLINGDIMDIVSINAEEWDHSTMRTEGVLNVINSSYSGSVQDGQGEWHVRGARGGATEYIIDGVRVSEMNGLPSTSIENVSMITGGIPAMYGDLTSGVIIVTTKDCFSMMRRKNVSHAKFKERQDYKRKQKAEKEDNEKRAKQIEEEKKKGK